MKIEAVLSNLYWVSLLTLLVVNCQPPASEANYYHKNQTVAAVGMGGADTLPVFESEAQLHNQKFIILKEIQQSCPQLIGQTLSKDKAIKILRYEAWKMKADGLIYKGITLESFLPENCPYLDNIAHGQAIKFLK